MRLSNCVGNRQCDPPRDQALSPSSKACQSSAAHAPRQTLLGSSPRGRASQISPRLDTDRATGRGAASPAAKASGTGATKFNCQIALPSSRCVADKSFNRIPSRASRSNSWIRTCPNTSRLTHPRFPQLLAHLRRPASFRVPAGSGAAAPRPERPSSSTFRTASSSPSSTWSRPGPAPAADRHPVAPRILSTWRAPARDATVRSGATAGQGRSCHRAGRTAL